MKTLCYYRASTPVHAAWHSWPCMACRLHSFYCPSNAWQSVKMLSRCHKRQANSLLAWLYNMDQVLLLDARPKKLCYYRGLLTIPLMSLRNDG